MIVVADFFWNLLDSSLKSCTVTSLSEIRAAERKGKIELLRSDQFASDVLNQA